MPINLEQITADRADFGPWTAEPWGDGSSLSGCLNVVDNKLKLVIVQDIPDIAARLIAAAPELADFYIAVKEALARDLHPVEKLDLIAAIARGDG